MSHRVLLAWPPGKAVARLARELRERLPNESIEVVASQTEAQIELEKRVHRLLITKADLASSEDAVAVSNGYPGIQLLAWMRELALNVPVIVTAPVLEAKLTDALLPFPDAKLIIEGIDLYQNVSDAAVATPKDIFPKSIKVIITADPRQNEWRYELVGENFPFTGRGPLTINAARLEELKERSNNLKDDTNWHANLRFLGGDLMREIFNNNVDFYVALSRAWGMLDARVDKTTICFHIAKSVHPIFLEAIVSDDVANKFWMLNAPIYRRLDGVVCSRDAIFGKKGRIGGKLNCLIIEADTSGPVADLFENNQPLSLTKLQYVSKECALLEKLLLDNSERFGIGRVLRVTKDFVGSKPFFEVLRNLLSVEKWHLVHYGGHSFYDRAEDKGYLFFPSAVDGDIPEKVTIARFAAHLNDIQLLFLSGCESSEMNFVSALANSNIPAAIGFRFKVQDEHAIDYAIKFYSELFNSQRLDRAFLNARQLMHDAHPADRIWANPVLLMQSN